MARPLPPVYNPLMRPLLLTLLAALSALSADQAAYPLWDGQETIAEYAKRTGLEPTKTLDLGNGVTMEFVLNIWGQRLSEGISMDG